MASRQRIGTQGVKGTYQSAKYMAEFTMERPMPFRGLILDVLRTDLERTALYYQNTTSIWANELAASFSPQNPLASRRDILNRTTGVMVAWSPLLEEAAERSRKSRIVIDITTAYQGIEFRSHGRSVVVPEAVTIFDRAGESSPAYETDSVMVLHPSGSLMPGAGGAWATYASVSLAKRDGIYVEHNPHGSHGISWVEPEVAKAAREE